MPEQEVPVEIETETEDVEGPPQDPENPSGLGDGTVVKGLTVEDGWVEEKIVHEEPDPETGELQWHKEAGE